MSRKPPSRTTVSDRGLDNTSVVPEAHTSVGVAACTTDEVRVVALVGCKMVAHLTFVDIPTITVQPIVKCAAINDRSR